MFLHCWKEYKICYRSNYQLAIRMLLHYFGILKIYTTFLLQWRYRDTDIKQLSIAKNSSVLNHVFLIRIVDKLSQLCRKIYYVILLKTDDAMTYCLLLLYLYCVYVFFAVLFCYHF